MQLDDVRYEAEGRLALVTLDRAEARNAYSEGMVDGLVEALDLANADEAVRCLVLTGDGPAFHAGGDLKRMREDRGMFAGDAARLHRAYIDGIQRVSRAFAASHKPIVAAINGPAIGAGLDLACMCDVRVASDKAKLGSTFVRIGLVPGDGGAYLLARTIGFPRALELMLTGRVIGADEAYGMGLVNQVVGPDALLETARHWAEGIAAHPPFAVALTRRAAYRSWDASLDGALELAAAYQGMAQRTPEHREAVDAMLKR